MSAIDVQPTKKVPPSERLSFEEFLDWCDEDTHAEWADGKVIVFSPASSTHQRIGGFLEAILRVYVEKMEIGEILGAPFLMRMPELKRGREPDILFVSSERLDIIEETYLSEPADLVVEIISPDSISRDRGRKFTEYEQSGINEYWIIDPYRGEALFYQLGEDGHYYSVKSSSSEIYRSKIIEGFWLKEKWLWEIPPILDVLDELNLLS